MIGSDNETFESADILGPIKEVTVSLSTPIELGLELVVISI
jgi:hypothetical protein